MSTIRTLSQVVGVEKTVKGEHASRLSKLSQLLEKPQLFNGFTKVYSKKVEDSEDQPPQTVKVQFKVADVLKDARKSWTELIDIVARKDYGNCSAKADLIVDGKVLLEQAPATLLMDLEKILQEVKSYFAAKVPVLDPAETWTKDENSGLFRTEPTQTTSTKKVQKGLVLYPATDKHPAQTQLITEDVPVGNWTQVKQSGAVPAPFKAEFAERVEKLLIAVKEAHVAANNVSVPQVTAGDKIFEYLLQ